MRARLPVFLLLLLATIPLLGGCGGSDTLSPGDVAKVADATVAKGGTKIAIVSHSTLAGGQQVTLSGQGAMNGLTRQGHLTLTPTSLTGLPASIDKNTLRQELVLDHFVFYLRSPAFAARLKNGKTWIKLDLQKAGKAAGIDLSVLAQSGQDPTQSLRLLKAISGHVDKVGSEDVRGVSTTHYKATVDFKKYPETLPAKDRAAARSTIDNLLARLGKSTSPVEFWIGKDNLVRRYVQSLALKLPTGAMSIKQQIEFYDYGTKVDVTIPPAGEVQDLSDVAAAGIRGSTP